MSLETQVLGGPARDNAVLARLDTGQFKASLLFDCGDCLHSLSLKDLRSIDHLFFSHLHMDHIAGFDAFFRCVYRRTEQPNHIWVPEGSAAIIQRRMQGFWWNLPVETEVEWQIHEIGPDCLKSYSTNLSEGFKELRKIAQSSHDGYVLKTTQYSVKAIPVEHHGLCLAYLLTEADKQNMDTPKLLADGFKPGRWVGELLNGSEAKISIEGKEFETAQLKKDYLKTSKGAKIAYLTDFLMDEETYSRLKQELQGVDQIIAESQFIEADRERAKNTCHMTSSDSARLAKACGAKELTLFHISDRYPKEEWQLILREAQKIFANTNFPSSWRID